MTEIAWLSELNRRYGDFLSFPEIRKGVAALSRIYVENRRGIGDGSVFEGAGKRAAFACFFSPLHFLLVRDVVRALGADAPAPSRILDLGCGLGVAGLAWAEVCGYTPQLLGFEKNAWAAGEARQLLRALGVRGRVVRRPLEEAPMAGRGDAVVSAFAVNELPASIRDRALSRLLAGSGRGARILVIEPIARRPIPWWSEWSRKFLAAGGREDSWRFPARLPGSLLALDRASGLDHRELTARSLYLPGLVRKDRLPRGGGRDTIGP